MATRWACVGPGYIARDFFYAIRDNLPEKDHEFVAVASRDLLRAQRFAEDFKFKRSYGSYDEIAKDEDVEVVYISTVSLFHAELSIKMLEAGKHVLCEKPMAMNLRDARIVHDTARKNKRFFMEGYWSKFNPVYAQVRKELENGSLGNIRLFQANMCLSYLPGSPEVNGGSLMLLGVYTVLLACMVFKEKPEVIKATGILTDNKVMDIGCSIMLTYKNGAMANLACHFDTGNGDMSARIMGTKNMIEVHGPCNCPVKVTTPTGTYDFPIKDGKYTFTNSGALHYEATAVRETILSGKLENELQTFEDSEMILSITDEVRKQIGLVYPNDD